jgi:hypothetical protein
MQIKCTLESVKVPAMFTVNKFVILVVVGAELNSIKVKPILNRNENLLVLYLVVLGKF